MSTPLKGVGFKSLRPDQSPVDVWIFIFVCFFANLELLAMEKQVCNMV